MQRFKNYIFDFGQVIVRFDTEHMTNAYIDKEDVKVAETVIFDRLYWDRLDSGTITDAEVKEGICSRLPEYLHKSACMVYDKWYENLSFIDGIPELISRIKESGGKIYLLSNISNTFAEKYCEVPMLKALLDEFDGLVFSAPINLTKPNKEIYRYILEKYGLDAKETVFIDDNEKNIKGAQSEGIIGYLFNGDVGELEKFLGV